MDPENSLPKGPQTISFADGEGMRQVLVRAVFGLWEIVNELTRLRPSKRDCQPVGKRMGQVRKGQLFTAVIERPRSALEPSTRVPRRAFSIRAPPVAFVRSPSAAPGNR